MEQIITAQRRYAKMGQKIYLCFPHLRLSSKLEPRYIFDIFFVLIGFVGMTGFERRSRSGAPLKNIYFLPRNHQSKNTNHHRFEQTEREAGGIFLLFAAGLHATQQQQKKQQNFSVLLSAHFVGMTGFEPATTRPPDVYSNRAELHPVVCIELLLTFGAFIEK